MLTTSLVAFSLLSALAQMLSADQVMLQVLLPPACLVSRAEIRRHSSDCA